MEISGKELPEDDAKSGYIIARTMLWEGA